VLDFSASVFLAHERVVSGSIVCAPLVCLACGYVEALPKMVIDWSWHMVNSAFCNEVRIYITLSLQEIFTAIFLFFCIAVGTRNQGLALRQPRQDSLSD
jgi:hypothetical protein